MTVFNHTHITILLDRSGSMASLRSDVVGGVNSLIEEQKKDGEDAFISIILFDSEDPELVLRERTPIAECGLLEMTDFVPRASTPLRDAMARAISRVSGRDENHVFVVMTDGYENASRETTPEALKATVEARTADGWIFQYLGANIDAFSAGVSVGMSAANVQNFTATSQGVGHAMSSASTLTSAARSRYRSKLSVDASNAYDDLGVERSGQKHYEESKK